MIKNVEVFKTQDGSLFEDENKANYHEYTFLLKRFLIEQKSYDVDINEFLEFLFNNKKIIDKIYNFMQQYQDIAFMKRTLSELETEIGKAKD